MSHYVYRTKRGLLRTVQATGGCDAWRLAERHHAVAEVHDLSGATWRYSAAIPGPHRDEGVYLAPEQAHALYLDACTAELSVSAMTMMRDIAEGRPPTFSRRGRSEHGGAVRAQFALFSRGLVSDMTADCALTDLGRALVARTEGGA